MIERTDELLALRFRERSDREALADLIRRYQTPIYSYLLRLLKNPHDAEEAAQECFVRMIQGLGRYREELPFRPWIYRIALNCARSAAVRSKIQAERERLAASSRPEGAKDMNPADAAARREILKMVDELPDAQKEAVTLHYCQGLSHSEVATALEIPAGTAATRIHTGLQSLRARLASIGIAAAGLTLEEVLSSAEAAAAPSSILKSVLGEVARLAPSGACAAAAVQGGLIVVKTKVSVMMAIALACTVGGGVAGYSVRGTREERAAMPELPASSRVLTAPTARVEPRPVPVASPAKVPAPSAPAAVAIAADPRKAKIRKLAAFFARMVKEAGAGKATNEFDQKESAEFFTLMMDPEMQKLSEGTLNGGGALELGGEFYVALLEEFGVRLSDGQKEQFNHILAEQDAVGRNFQGATAVDLRIHDLHAGRSLIEKTMEILTPEQRESAGVFGQLWSGVGTGVVVKLDSHDQAVPSLLEAWSEKLVPLSAEDRTRLAQAATVHAGQILSVQQELQSKYGQEFVGRLAAQLGAESSTFGNPAEDRPKLHDAYTRLLEIERQNRATLMAVLPEKAEAIRKAEAYVYLFSAKK